MKNQKHQIVIADDNADLGQTEKIIAAAEKLAAFINAHELPEMMQLINMGEFEGWLMPNFPISDSKVFFTGAQKNNETPVMMLTYHEANFFDREYSCVGSDYFLRQAKSYELTPVGLSMLSLN